MTLHDVTRAAAGLPERAQGPRRRASAIDALVVHYSTGEELGQPDAFAWWRSIHRYHTRNNGWADIGYNYGIHARQPLVLEGRGLLVAGAHAPDWNTRGVGLCILGDDDPGQDVLDDVIARIFRFRDELEAELGRRLHVFGHRETQRAGYTACPGDEVIDRVVVPLRRRDPSPGPTPKPEPEPAPSTEELPMPPTIRTGDRGFYVRLMQAALVAHRHDLSQEGGVDGVFGAGTARELAAFQRARGLPPSGVCDAATWRRLWQP